MSLELSGIVAAYGETVVLRGVDLVVPAGRVSALVGPNGAGKTTLLRVASGLLRPRPGRVVLDGRLVTTASPDGLQHLGLCHVPEGRAIFPSLTVSENIRVFAPGDRDGALARATDAFPTLRARLHQVAGTLSGGEQQMLALARAYVTNPRFVLLDEPSMGLAPLVVDEIFSFIARLAAEGCAVLLVEQYVHRALVLADFAYVLRKGQLVFAGVPAELDVDRLAVDYLGAAPRATPQESEHQRAPCVGVWGRSHQGVTA